MVFAQTHRCGPDASKEFYRRCADFIVYEEP